MVSEDPGSGGHPNEFYVGRSGRFSLDDFGLYDFDTGATSPAMPGAGASSFGLDSDIF